MLSPSIALQGRSVLVVEDEEGVGKIIADTVASCGMSATLVRTGAEAFRRLQLEEYDYCIIDVLLPDIHGTQVAEWAQAWRPGSNILLTSGSTQDCAAYTLPENAHFLPKPFLPSQLTTKLLEIAPIERTN